MTQNETSILKNAVLDATEAYLEARLAVADFVKTQIGVVQSYTVKNKKYYHTVNCDNGRVTYNNVLSIGNTPYPQNSVVFLIAPNAQFSNQFILGKLDDTPVNISGGSIDIGNGNFVVTSQGVMTAKQGTFEGTITGGSININDKFIVDDQGNMEATTGTISDFTLGDGALYAWGIINFRNNIKISATSNKTFKKELSSFIPATLGVLSTFKINFDYKVLTSSSRNMYIYLQRYDTYDKEWVDVEDGIRLNNVVDAEESITFNKTFNNTDNRSYRIYFKINSTSSSTNYQQSIRYSIYTNRVISTALTIEGYNGKINSASGTIGGIDYGTGRLSSLANGYSGFEIDSDSLEIRNDEGLLSENGDTFLMYSKSYTWAMGADYPVSGLFIRTDDTTSHTMLTLFKDINNVLNLYSDGSYSYYVNGTGYSGTLNNNSSDKRIKEEIKPLDIEMSKELINKTNTYKFKYKNNEGYHYGVIAQEARKLLDDLNEKDSKLEYSVGDTNIKNQRSINYQEYIPLLINVVQDLQKQINELKKEDK